MRCYKCGKVMKQTSAISEIVAEHTYQTTRHYECKCGNKQAETDDPVRYDDD